jgi:uncharacterized membrane protein
MEAFSDCVIAFAITLLILDIHLDDVGGISNAAMIHALLDLVPRFSIYVISFLICTVAWVSHHELIHDVDYVDSRLLWLNNLYLMWIAFLPFPTGLLGHHPDHPVAVALYGAVCAIACLSSFVLRWYASFRGRLMKREIGETRLRRDLRLSLYSSSLPCRHDRRILLPLVRSLPLRRHSSVVRNQRTPQSQRARHSALKRCRLCLAN